MKTNMKIKLTNHEHFKEVAKALAGEGYRDVTNEPHYQKATALYTYEIGEVMYTFATDSDYFFCLHNNEEHFLVNGKFVTKYYWTQPATETTYQPLPAPPLGLRPRKLHNEARIIDILEALTRYVEAGKPIDQDWLDELNCLIMENQ